MLRIERSQSAVWGTPSEVELIWPASGPSGTLVQVVASAFPANTEVSVGLEPVSSQFGEVAKGTTDADGFFSVQVLVEGELGVAWVFAVAAEGVSRGSYVLICSKWLGEQMAADVCRRNRKRPKPLLGLMGGLAMRVVAQDIDRGAGHAGSAAPFPVLQVARMCWHPPLANM